MYVKEHRLLSPKGDDHFWPTIAPSVAAYPSLLCSVQCKAFEDQRNHRRAVTTEVVYYTPGTWGLFFLPSYFIPFGNTC